MKGRPPKLTKDMIEAIVARYQAGVTITDIAIEFNMVASTVAKGLKEAGISAGQNGENASKYATSVSDVDPELEALIISDFKEGLTIRQLQLKYRLNNVVLAQILTKHGLRQTPVVSIMERKIHKPSAPTNLMLSEDKQLSLIEDYLGHGVPRNILSVQYKIPLEVVSTILKNAGIAALRITVPPELEERICNDYKQGFMTPYDLGKIYDISPTLIRYILGRNHLTSSDENGKMIIGANLAQTRRLAVDAGPDVCKYLLKPHLIQVWQ
jgi:transposase-like protein